MKTRGSTGRFFQFEDTDKRAIQARIVLAGIEQRAVARAAFPAYASPESLLSHLLAGRGWMGEDAYDRMMRYIRAEEKKNKKSGRIKK